MVFLPHTNTVLNFTGTVLWYYHRAWVTCGGSHICSPFSISELFAIFFEADAVPLSLYTRRIRQLSDIARITCGSIFSSANRLESVESPTFWRMNSILFQNGGVTGNEGAWKLTFLRCIVGTSSESLLMKFFVLLITLLLEVNAALRSTSSQP